MLGLVLDGGYTLADLDFAQRIAERRRRCRLRRRRRAKSDAAALEPPRQDDPGRGTCSNVPDVTVTGSIDSDKAAGENGRTSRRRQRRGRRRNPPTPKPAGGGTVITLDPKRCRRPPSARSWSACSERRQELDARARELEIRENLLKAAEKRLDGARRRAQGHGGAASAARRSRRSEAEAARLKSLVTMYENMKAKDAAKIFDRLEMRVLIEVVTQINPRRMSDILALMPPEAAERLTVELANRASGIETAPAPVELPKIEGRPK